MIAAVVLLLIFCGIAALCYFQRKLSEQVRQVSNVGAMEMKNGLIVSVPIGKYENSNVFSDLSVDIDARKMKDLAEFLKFDYLAIDGKLKWNESEVMDFMKNRVGKEFFDDEGTAKYDGLIVSFSGHGVRNHVVCSDGMLIDRTAIHRCISNQYPQIREYPRIFIFDACDGAGDRRETVDKMIKVSSVSTDTDFELVYDEEKQKGILEEEEVTPKCTKLNDVQTTNEWTTNTKNPDCNLIAVHASNAGFVAKMNNSEEVGSYLTYFFAKQVKRNVSDGTGKVLGDMMDEVEEVLHDHGKQLIRTEFFTGTRKLRIERNVFG